MRENILIVDDEERIRRLIKAYLVKDNFNVFEAEQGVEALKIIRENKIDLVVLDVMMPYMDGWDMCKELRKKSNLPIIMLTAKSQEDDKLLGYELGVDDYVTKPFSPKILIAKIKAVIKRNSSHDTLQGNNLIDFNGLVINEESHEITLDGNEVYLAPKEYELLIYFVKNKGIALTRDKILDAVWGMDYYGDFRTVDTHVKRVREKLSEKAYLITTVRGSGYKFEIKNENK